jgi:hypothetical protein
MVVLWTSPVPELCWTIHSRMTSTPRLPGSSDSRRMGDEERASTRCRIPRSIPACSSQSMQTKEPTCGK